MKRQNFKYVQGQMENKQNWLNLEFISYTWSYIVTSLFNTGYLYSNIPNMIVALWNSNVYIYNFTFRNQTTSLS